MFTEDLTPFMDIDAGFAVAVVINGVTVSAIFDAPYATADVGPFGMASTAPVLTLPTASVPSSPVGKAVQVGAASYRIAAHEPDGSGMSRLVLESAA